jgi:zinc and cadmium transporter
MVSELIYILGSTILISLISLIGIFTLHIKENLLDKVLHLLISLSAGALLGGAFLHLIPESIEKFQSDFVFLLILLGFILFFFIEKVLHWRHCHDGKCEVHTFAYMNLVGDAIHNFLDGLIIASSFLINTSLGVSTTIAVLFHEVPQELGDFGVLIHGGIKKTKAILFNFLTATTAILGGIIGYLFSNAESTITILLPIAAGGFIYISASDLIPEIRKELEFKKYASSFVVFLLGILIMYGLTFIG